MGSIVKAYTAASLTYEKDKLVAISGIAARMQILLDDQYLAGLWWRDLAGELMWCTRDKNSTRATRYIAPSWSWASVIGTIDGVSQAHLDGVDSGKLIEITSVSVEYETSNAFGQVTNGSLRLKGKLGKLVLYTDLSGAVLCECLLGVRVVIDRDVRFANGNPVEEINDYLFYLPIRGDSRTMEGLLLEPAGAPGEFRRYGVFYSSGVPAAELLTKGCEYFDSRADGARLVYFNGGEGGYNYAITII